MIQYHRFLDSVGFCYVCFRRQKLDSEEACLVMAVLYCHDATSTLRIESRTPEAEVLLLGQSLELIQRNVVCEKPLVSCKSLGYFVPGCRPLRIPSLQFENLVSVGDGTQVVSLSHCWDSETTWVASG